MKTVYGEHLDNCIQAILKNGHHVKVEEDGSDLLSETLKVRIYYPSVRKDWNQIEHSVSNVFKMYGFGGIKSCVEKTDEYRVYDICIVPCSLISKFIRTYLTRLINVQFNSIVSFTNKELDKERINIKIEHEVERHDNGYSIRFSVLPSKVKEKLSKEEYDTLRAIYEINKVNIVGRFKGTDSFPHLKMDVGGYYYDPDGRYFEIHMVYDKPTAIIPYEAKRTFKTMMNDWIDVVCVSCFISVERVKQFFKKK